MKLKKKKTIRTTLISSAALILLALVSFLAVNGYFYVNQYFHIGPGITAINHIDVTGMNLTEAYEELVNLDNYDVMTIQEEEQTYEIPLNNFAQFEYNKDDLENLFGQYKNYFNYLFAFSQDFSLNKEVSIDQDKALHTLKEALEQQERTDNVDAKIEKQDNNFVLTAEQQGTRIDYDVLLDKLKNCLAEGIYAIDLTDCYTKPVWTAEMLNKDYEELANMLNWKISYKSSAGKTFTIDRAAFFDHLTFSTAQGIKIDFRFLDAAIEQLKKEFDTIGTPREFTNFYGETLQISGGTYGYKINAEKEKQALMAMMYKCESQENRTPEYSRTEVSAERNGLGNTYIEVSIPNQHLWYYVDGVLVTETDIVTGMKNKHDTPTGIYYISEKKNGKYLTGEDYRTWVNKWMRLTNTGIGLHDATWKNQFGSNLYETKGSHGCINLPYDFACALYDMVKTNMPVVIW